MIVLASVDMLKNGFLMQRSGDYQGNIQFTQNALDIFGLGNKLIDVRIKQLTVRQFEEGSERLSTWIMAFCLIAMPLLVGAIGLVYYALRRRESIAYERQFVER